MSTRVKKQLNRNENVKPVVHDAIRQLQQANNDIIDNDLPSSLITTRGDLIVGIAGGAPDRLGVGAAGKILTSDGTDPSWAEPGWRIVAKTSDEARNNGGSGSTMTADSALSFAVLAATKYRFRMAVQYTTAATPDFKFDVNGPGSPTKIQFGYEFDTNDDDHGSFAVNAFASAVTIVSTAATFGSVRIEGLLQNGANAGTVAFRWAQNTANASNTTVLAGSFIEYATV